MAIEGISGSSNVEGIPKRIPADLEVGGTLVADSFAGNGAQLTDVLHDLSSQTTDQLEEGAQNFYLTDLRIDERISLQKAVPSGLATLDGAGKVPSLQLPAIAISNVFVVADLAVRDTLTVETGDVAKVLDYDGFGHRKSYIYDGTIWIELKSDDLVDSVNGQIGNVSLSTGDIPEGLNLYFTSARVSANADVSANTSARHTHANKTLLDTYAQLEVDLADAVFKKHSHSNFSLLETYTQSETNLASAVSLRHSHSNFALLETYTQTNTNLADAVTKKHAHSNYALLETYTQTETNLADAVAKKHSHSNFALLETYTQSETNLASAVSLKHSHSNFALLETYTQTNTNLADAVTKKHSHANQSILDATQESFTTTLKTKLDGIEALADVTTAAKVDAAGAIMNSDFTANGLMKRTGAGAYSIVADNSANWDAAFTERRQWDGGATNLVAATGRTSLALDSASTVQFTKLGLGTGTLGLSSLNILNASANVGLFIGNRTPFGQSLIETDVTAPATQIWLAENGNRIFSVTSGGGVYVGGALEIITSLRVNNGTTFARIQGGVGTIGGGAGGVKQVVINFPLAFTTTPTVVATPRGQGFADTFAMSIQTISVSSFTVNVYRVDSAGSGWGQNLLVDWLAWE